MKRTGRRLACLVTIIIFCTGCARAFPEGRQLVRDDVGPYPDDYVALVNSWLRANLKDPYSVQDLRISRPVQDRYWGGLRLSSSSAS